MFRPCGEVKAAAFNRRMRKTARPVVWEGDGAQSPSLDPIQKAWPHKTSADARRNSQKPRRTYSYLNASIGLIRDAFTAG